MNQVCSTGEDYIHYYKELKEPYIQRRHNTKLLDKYFKNLNNRDKKEILKENHKETQKET